jgi:hypothetical protein
MTGWIILDLEVACNTDRITSYCQGEGEDGTLVGGLAATGVEGDWLAGPVRVRCVVDKVALVQGFSAFGFPGQDHSTIASYSPFS